MTLGNGLKLNNDLDDRMREYTENIRQLSGEMSKLNQEIGSTQETLEELREQGLVTPELEQNFTAAIQRSMSEKDGLEQQRESILNQAKQELTEAKDEYEKAVDKVDINAGGQGAEILKAIRERVTELGEWKEKLEEAMNEDDEHDHILVKRMSLRR